MTTTTTTSEQSALKLRLDDTPLPQIQMFSGNDPQYGDFRDDLAHDGYAVVKGAVPSENALKYANSFYSYLEGFNLGYDRNDPSTIKRSKLPVVNEKGMIMHYGVSHEKWVWDIRSEPGVIGAFETVFNDKDLIVSFDAVNIGFHNREDFAENKPWPHQDQDPEKPGFRCLQGLVNLQSCGKDDGGLIVCKGAHLLSEEYHDVFRGEERIHQWTNEWYGFKETGLKWLEEKGCEWVKVCAEPGDLILWDSRAPHYNVPTRSKQDRMAVYTCYMPVSQATQEDLLRKKAAWDERRSTTHWPNARHSAPNAATRDGKPCQSNRAGPIEEPQLSERAFKLTGLPYIKIQEQTLDDLNKV